MMQISFKEYFIESLYKYYPYIKEEYHIIFHHVGKNQDEQKYSMTILSKNKTQLEMSIEIQISQKIITVAKLFSIEIVNAPHI